jgi:prepilin-type N-terminal cleavage/methylation domain-containing protein
LSAAGSGDSGFTLIEVIGAMVIFAIGVLVATSLSRDLTTLNRDARLRSEAAVIGRQLLDSLAVLSYDDFLVGGTVSGTVDLEGSPYARSYTTSQFGPRTREVLVRVVPPVDDGLSCRGTTFCATLYVVEEW